MKCPNQIPRPSALALSPGFAHPDDGRNTMKGEDIFGLILAPFLMFAIVWFIGPVLKEHRRKQENIAHGADTLPADPYARQGETRPPGGARIAADYIYAPERTYFRDDPEGPPLHPIKDIDVFVARRFFGPPIDIYADPFEAPYIDTAGKPGPPRREPVPLTQAEEAEQSSYYFSRPYARNLAHRPLRRALGTVDPARDYVDTAHPDAPPHPEAWRTPPAVAPAGKPTVRDTYSEFH